MGCDAVYFGRYTGRRTPEDFVFDIYLCDNLKSCITLASEFLQELDNKIEYPDIILFPSNLRRIAIQSTVCSESRCALRLR